MCVKVLGDKTGLDDDIRKRIAELEEATKDNDGLHFQIALNYGGRDELVRAAKSLAVKVAKGEVRPEDITEEMISDSLDTKGIQEPDLLIRTCNEQRISNFLFAFTSRIKPIPVASIIATKMPVGSKNT
jgi:undecaprenyl diphosphate synthase